MGFYQKNKKEIITLQLISQLLGKIKLEYAAQEPQWAHVVLDITPRGFSTGLLKYEDSYFQVEVDLIKHVMLVRTDEMDSSIKLTDGKTISEYYDELMEVSKSVGLTLSIYTKPQEMETTTLFEEDVEHHHYNESVAKEILEWFQFAWNVEQEFIAPFRQRKVYPGLFWGTFDVSCIVIYNKLEPFPEDNKVIERAAFDEHMIEFGFWLGDDNIKHPTFFTLAYPFVTDVKLEVDDSFPLRSYFSPTLGEYLYETNGNRTQVEAGEVSRFMKASCKKTFNYLEWQDTDHYFEELKMIKKE